MFYSIVKQNLMFLDQRLLIKDKERVLSQNSKFREIARPLNG